MALHIHPSVWCLFVVLIDSGSRYESAYPSGVTHFLEKLAFSVSASVSPGNVVM